MVSQEYDVKLSGAFLFLLSYLYINLSVKYVTNGGYLTFSV